MKKALIKKEEAEAEECSMNRRKRKNGLQIRRNVNGNNYVRKNIYIYLGFFGVVQESLKNPQGKWQ